MAGAHADPLGALMAWIAVRGAVGLVGVMLMERLLPIVPSYGVLVALGIAAAQGYWSLPSAALASTAGSLVGCAAVYTLCAAFDRRRSRTILGWMARLCRVSPAKLDELTMRFRARERLVAFASQLVPMVRLVAPGVAGLLGARPFTFVACAAAGVALWNLVFIGVGYVTAHLAVGVNASALALKTLVVLLIAEAALALLWRHLGQRARAAAAAAERS